jgi:hypothetical protein
MTRMLPEAGFTAHIIARRPMTYREGEDPALDRPGHVRAASGVAWLGDKLAVVQDDAHFIAWVDPASGLAEAIPLPADAQGRRLFDTKRGTKRLKLDLESCLVRVDETGATLLAFGSGSLPVRERIVELRWDTARAVPVSLTVRDASALYALLRAEQAFSGSELNVEGAVVRGGTLLLLQRGNGASRADQRAINAVGELDLAAFDRYLAGGVAPALARATSYDLGSIAGVPYTFTDATLGADGTLLFLASAEASEDSVADGTLHGSVVGELRDDGSVRTTPLLDEQGQPSRAKVEGIVLDRADPTLAFLVVDADAPDLAAELLTVRLTPR